MSQLHDAIRELKVLIDEPPVISTTQRLLQLIEALQRYIASIQTDATAASLLEDLLLTSLPPGGNGTNASSSSSSPVSKPQNLLGILRYLTATVSHDKGRLAILTLLVDLSKYPIYRSILRTNVSFTNTLTSISTYIIRAEKSARIRERGFDLLWSTLNISKNIDEDGNIADEVENDNSDDSELEQRTNNDPSSQVKDAPASSSPSISAGEISNMLFDELRKSKSALSQTIRGHVLSTLGLLSQLYPEQMSSRASQVADAYIYTFERETKNTSGLNRRIIVGCLTGLRYFLVHFSSMFPNNSKRQRSSSFVYKVVRAGLSLQDGKYDIFKAALYLFAAHCSLLAPHSTSTTEVEFLTSLLMEGSSHSNKSVQSGAVSGLDAYLSVLKTYLMSTDTQANGDAEKRQVFHYLMEVYVRDLDMSKSSNRFSTSIRAFGQLAGAIEKYMSKKELAIFLQRLINMNEHVYNSGSLGEIDKAISQIPSFMISIASILDRLANVDVTVLAHIRLMLSRFFISFPTLTSSQRIRTTSAACRLLTVIYFRHFSIFPMVLEQPLYQGLLLTISKLPNLSASMAGVLRYLDRGRPQINLDTDNSREAYVEYCYLWWGLLGVEVFHKMKYRTSYTKRYAWNIGLNYPASTVSRMRKELYNTLMTQLLQILRSLDYSLSLSDDSENPTEDRSESRNVSESLSTLIINVQSDQNKLMPAVENDYSLFLNLVEFFQRFFLPPPPHLQEKINIADTKISTSFLLNFKSSFGFHLTKWFLPWIFTFITELIDLSKRFPLASGFYKLMTILLFITHRHRIFDGITSGSADSVYNGKDSKGIFKLEPPDSPKPSQKFGEAMEDEDNLDESDEEGFDRSSFKEEKSTDEEPIANITLSPLTKQYIYQVLVIYVRDVISRALQFTHELQFAAIRLVLTIPPNFVSLEVIIPAVLKALQLGRVHHPSAVLAMDAVEFWTSIPELHADIISSLPVILPHFHNYLRIPQVIEDGTSVTTISKTTGSQDNEIVRNDINLELITRMLHFLGRVGPASRLLLDESEQMQVSAAWHTEKLIKYSLPFRNQKLDIYLDPLLPRISYLAEKSPDRSIKVTACEALHSIVIYMIAKTAKDPARYIQSASGSDSSSLCFAPIYAHLFPVMLRLATDAEGVTHQLFRPLVLQLVHWFSSIVGATNTATCQEISELIRACVDSVSSPHDASLREFSAECLSEFIVWCAKHQALENKGQINITSLMSQIIALARHSDPLKRYGACLTFNRMYRTFRESKYLVQEWILTWTRTILACIRLSDEDDPTIGTRDEARQALQHISRILTDRKAQRYTLLLVDPSSLEQNLSSNISVECKDLFSFVNWLILQCSSLEDTYRRECMSLFVEIAPFTLSGGKEAEVSQGVSKWIKNHLTIESLLAIAENGELTDENGHQTSSRLQPPSDLRKYTQHSIANPNAAFGDSLPIIKWLKALAATLDVHYWIFHNKFLSPSHALIRNPSSNIFSVILYFVDWCATQSTSPLASDAALPLLDVHVQKFQSMISTVLLRLFRLISEIFQQNEPELKQLIISRIITPNFLVLMFDCLLRSDHRILTINNEIGSLSTLQHTIGVVCTHLLNSNADCREAVITTLRSTLADPYCNPSFFTISSMLNNIPRVSALVDGYKELWNSKLLLECMGREPSTNFANSLLQMTFDLQSYDSNSTENISQEGIMQNEAMYVKRKRLLNPLVKQVAHKALQLALHLGVSSQKLIELLNIDQTRSFASTASAGNDLDSGQLFYDCFRSLIDSYLSVSYQETSTCLIMNALKNHSMFVILLNVMNYVIQRLMRKRAGVPIHLSTALSESAKSRGIVEISMVSDAVKEADEFVASTLLKFPKLYEICHVSPSQAESLTSANLTASNSTNLVRSTRKPTARNRTATTSTPATLDIPNYAAFPTPDAEQCRLVVKLLDGLLVLNQNATLNTSSNAYRLFSHLYCVFISSRSPLPLRKEALALLPRFFVSMPSLYIDRVNHPPAVEIQTVVLSTLRTIVTEPPFPLKSTELAKGSEMWRDYASMMDLLLTAISKCKSFSLIKDLLVLFREQHHAHSQPILASMKAFISAINEPGKLDQIFHVCQEAIDLYFDRDLDIHPVDNARCWVVKVILAPLLLIAPVSVVKRLFQNYGKQLYALLEAVPDGPPLSFDMNAAKLAFYEMQCCYHLLDTMFRRLKVAEITEEIQFPHKDLIKLANNHVKKLASNWLHVPLFDFRSAALSCLISALKCTQNQSRFFHAIAFKEMADKGQTIWDHVIDTSSRFNENFVLDTSFKQIRQDLADILTLDQEKMSDKISYESDENPIPMNSLQNIQRYLSSQYASSSLADSLRFSDIPECSSMNVPDTSSDVINNMNDSGNEPDLLDVDVVLNQPIVPVYLQLIDFMHSTFDQKVSSTQVMPEWMDELYLKITASSSPHINIRWTIVKFVVVKWKIFQPFAKFWWRPLAEMAILPTSLGGGIGFHYFLRDICATFLRWTNFLPANTDRDRELATSFLHHLMKVSVDYGETKQGRRGRLRSNLMLIKLLLGRWKTRVRIDKNVFKDLLQIDISSGDRRNAEYDPKLSRFVSLQLIAITLDCGFTIYDPVADANFQETSLIDTMLNCITNTHKSIHEPTADVYGLIVKNNHSSRSATANQPWISGIQSAWNKLFFQQNYAHFFTVLVQYGQHVASILPVFDREFITKVFAIPFVNNALFHQQLTVILWAATSVEGICTSIRPWIDLILKGSDFRTQQLLLMIFIRHLKEFSHSELIALLTKLSQLFMNHSYHSCRELYYKMLMEIVKLSPPSTDKSATSLSRKAFIGILHSLGDPVLSLRTALFKFVDEMYATLELPERLLTCLSAFYCNETLPQWVAYSTRFLLSPTESSSDFNRAISDEAIPTAHFKPLKINSDYNQSSPYTPLFAGKQTGNQSDSSLNQMQNEDGNGNLILATQDPSFSATQSLLTMDVDNLLAYNLSQQASQSHLFFRPAGTFNEVQGSLADYQMTAVERQIKQKQQQRKRLALKTIPKFVTETGDSVPLRFPSQNSAYYRSGSFRFAQAADFRNRYTKSWEIKRREAFRQRVSLFRAYRTGELPDIQIPHKDLLLPLQGLYTDTTYSQQCLLLIWQAIVAQISQWKPPEQISDYKDALSSDLRSMLIEIAKESPAIANTSGPAVSSLQAICGECAKLDDVFTVKFTVSDIHLVGKLGQLAKAYHSTILWYECLLNSAPKPQKRSASTRRRKSQSMVATALDPRSEQIYLQLASLYSSLGEKKVQLHLIEIASLQDQTKDAMNLILHGNYSEALKTFDEALELFEQSQSRMKDTDADETQDNWNNSRSTSAEEVEIWNVGRLDSIAALTDWSILRENVLVEVDHNVDRLWEDEYQRTHYLSFYFKSSIRQFEERYITHSNSSDSKDISDEIVSESRKELISFVDRALMHASHKSNLLDQYSANLVLVSAQRGEVFRALHYLNSTYTSFLKKWESLPNLSRLPRIEMLRSLQPISEIAEVLKIHPNSQARVSTRLSAHRAKDDWIGMAEDVKQLFYTWSIRVPSNSDDADLWNELLLNRATFALHLQHSLDAKLDTIASVPCSAEITSCRLQLMREIQEQVARDILQSFRKAANLQMHLGNTVLATKYLETAQQFYQSNVYKNAEIEVLVSYSFLKLNLYSVNAEVEQSFGTLDSDAANGAMGTLTNLIASISKIEHQLNLNQRQIQDRYPLFASRFLLLKASSNDRIARLIISNPHANLIPTSRSATERLQDADDDFTSAATILSKISLADEFAQVRDFFGSDIVKQRSAKGMLTVAQFCQSRLSAAENHFDSCKHCTLTKPCGHPHSLLPKIRTHLMELFIFNVLFAIRLQSRNARALFPRCLEFVAQCPLNSLARHELLVTTSSLCDKRGVAHNLGPCECSLQGNLPHCSASQFIPEWMFLQWIPQLMATLGLSESLLTLPIIVRLAKAYPQAVYFPFKMSTASIKDKAGEDPPALSPSINNFLLTVTSTLESRLITTFIEAMEDLTPPDILLKEFFGSIFRCIRHNQRKEALVVYQQFYQRIIALERQYVSTDLIGEWHRAVAPILRSLFDEHFGSNGEKLKSIQPKRISELQELVSNDSRLKSVRPKVVQLSSFSNWLANYELLANRTGEIIEIPGQYTGESMPNPSTHAKLVSFDRNIRVMNSLRRPVALTLRADDQHDYKFLVKSGEDLRLDQRVIQLLQSMNNILDNDKNCSERDLRLTTYPVIPFTPKLGMIGWVNNTVPVKSVLSTAASHPSLHSVNERYAEFVRKFNPQGKPHEAHISLIEKGSRDEVVRTFTTLEELLAPDLFRRVLSSMAATPESFFVLRTRFARSYAVANICGYILGIGDRHLENYLLDTSSGSMLLIDFGAAFGCGVLLGVPELMPFRFTRQFRNILSPLQSVKLLQLEMTTVLQALRSKQDQLLTLMDVFVKEPQIDWIQIAKKNTKSAFRTSYALSRSNSNRDSTRTSPNITEDDNNFSSDDIRWLPKQKIAIAHAKLRGRNSAYIMCDELREHPASTGQPSLIASAQAIVRGAADSLRTTVGEYCSSVEEQVACLIEHASDPNILGRTWQGWYPLV